jgi:hypothetical protein
VAQCAAAADSLQTQARHLMTAVAAFHLPAGSAVGVEG